MYTGDFLKQLYLPYVSKYMVKLKEHTNIIKMITMKTK